MTDLPKATRDKLVGNLFPQLLTAHRTQTADQGTTVKNPVAPFDGAKVESSSCGTPTAARCACRARRDAVSRARSARPASSA